MDRITWYENVKAFFSALQVRETHQFEVLRRSNEAASGVPEGLRGKGLGSEVGLAKRLSPSQGARDIEAAKALVEDMPGALEALMAGQISEQSATSITQTAAALTPTERRQVDKAMEDRYGKVAPWRLKGEVRALTEQVDSANALERHRRAAKGRRVWLRQEDDGMATLNAYLPLVDATACLNALKAAANSQTARGLAAGRGHGQLAADMLTELLTGGGPEAESEGQVVTEVLIQITDAALFGLNRFEYQRATAGHKAAESPDRDREHRSPELVGGLMEETAWLPGHGAIPASLVRDWLAHHPGKVFYRRLFANPVTEELTAMDTRRRQFPTVLRKAILSRDDRCRTPGCGAPIRHSDHATPVKEGGATNWENAVGLCAHCNFTKENPNWTAEMQGGTLHLTTPTGHTYTSAPPKPPRLGRSQ